MPKLTFKAITSDTSLLTPTDEIAIAALIVAVLGIVLQGVRFYWEQIRPGRAECSIPRWDCTEVTNDLKRCNVHIAVTLANHTRRDWVIPFLFFSRSDIVKRKPEDIKGGRAADFYNRLVTETTAELTGIDPDTRRFQSPIVVRSGETQTLQMDLALPFRPLAFRIHAYQPSVRSETSDWKYFDPAVKELGKWLWTHTDAESRLRAIRYLVEYPTEHPPFDYYGLPTPAAPTKGEEST